MMKKFFTLKNCLIVLFLLGVASYFIAHVINTTNLIINYNKEISFLNEAISSGDPNTIIGDGFIEFYINIRNYLISILVMNYFILLLIGTFIILLVSNLFNKLNCLKFAFITLAFLCFVIYVFELALPMFIKNLTEINLTDNLATQITALIALLISIPCYIYLLLKELKQRKQAKQEITTDTVDQIDTAQE